MGRRAFLYPFDISFAEIFKYKEQICILYDTIYPVVAQGLPYENMDVGIICKDRKWHATVCSDYRELLSSCTDAIITNDSSDSMEAMRIAISHNLNVVCLFPFRSRDIEQSVLQMCEKKGVSYTNYSSIQNYSYDHKNLEKTVLQDLSTPVVMICGMARDTQKFDVQLALRKEFLSQGYRVTQIGTKDYSAWFGMHPFPSFMFQPQHDIQKIFMFNEYIKKLEIEEKPDLILLGIPGGTLPFDSLHPNDFGILCYLASQAVAVDYTVFSAAFLEYERGYYPYIAKVLRYRYGVEKVVLHLSNVYHDIEDDERTMKERLLRIGGSHVHDVLKKFPAKKVCTVADVSSMRAITNQIIEYLAS